MSAPTAIRHLAFEPRRAVALADARLSDRERLALLFQSTAVLAHLEQAGWRLGSALEDARVDPQGLLVLPAPQPGAAYEQTQELLLRLLARLFGDERVPGRGEARRVAKRLARRLRQTLTPVPAERWLAEILGEAPFLWSDALGGARRALAAERVNGERAQLWVVGPGAFRRRMLSLAASRVELEAILASAEARSLWLSQLEGKPRDLARAGRFAAATAAWEIEPPQNDDERLELAQALAALGRSERALDALSTLASPESKLLRARCQVDLGRLAAVQGTLRQLQEVQLAPRATVEMAELAIKVLANLGRTDELEPWVARARKAAGRGPLASRARLLEAVAAWDQAKQVEAERHLEASRAALDDPGLAWQWRKTASLVAQARGDIERARRLLEEALAAGRRRLTRREAGELWNELGICRAAAGDLAGAERAFLHTARLWSASEGPRATTLALFNLAEIRLRRGRLKGVREILEEATLENRLAANLRGSIQDLELWARYELAFGRFASALEHVRGALHLLDANQLSFREDVLRMFAARALAWLGRGDEAAAELEKGGERAILELEPEERPALLALAGMRAKALEIAATTPWPWLWQTLLLQGALPTSRWQELSDLEPFRRARLVLDAEMLVVGSVPPEIRAWAGREFRAQAATALADQLEGPDHGAWRDLAAYLAHTPDPEALLSLLARAEPRLRVERQGPEGTRALLHGPGGVERVERPCGDGLLVASAPASDPRLEALLTLLAREIEGGAVAPIDAVKPSRGRAHLGAMLVGESPSLLAAVERLLKLAPSDLPVLILGESGTGKELAARLVHDASPRAEKPFVAMNCAAVSENLLLSDLFGHVRGAFTGADRDRAGVFETAQGGTVFLDEIGDLPLSAQGMLLRVLQESEVRRVGESLPRKIKARVVAATHRDLASMVVAGSFRNDLFFRLKVAHVALPPLAARLEDIPRLVEHFLAKPSSRKRSVTISASALATLTRYPWPGNVRELENVLKVAAELAATEHGRIETHHLELPEAVGSTRAASEVSDYHALVDAFRTKLIRDALAGASGNRAEAARRLKLTRQAFSYLARNLRIA